MLFDWKGYAFTLFLAGQLAIDNRNGQSERMVKGLGVYELVHYDLYRVEVAYAPCECRGHSSMT